MSDKPTEDLSGRLLTEEMFSRPIEERSNRLTEKISGISFTEERFSKSPTEEGSDRSTEEMSARKKEERSPTTEEWSGRPSTEESSSRPSIENRTKKPIKFQLVKWWNAISKNSSQRKQFNESEPLPKIFDEAKDKHTSAEEQTSLPNNDTAEKTSQQPIHVKSISQSSIIYL